MTPELPAVPAAPNRVITVINIEDQREIREGLAVLIDATEGYRCVGRYRSMEEALAGIGPHGPDVALVDIGLPGMDGYEVARRIREALGDARPRLVAVTGYGQQGDRQRALEAGFDAHLVKPAPPAQLQRALRARA